MTMSPETFWVFMICYNDPPKNDPLAGDLWPAFQHTFIQAQNKDEAYTKGQRWAEAQGIYEKYDALNDYVIPFQEFQEAYSSEHWKYLQADQETVSKNRKKAMEV